MIGSVIASEKNKIEDEIKMPAYESFDQNAVISSANAVPEDKIEVIISDVLKEETEERLSEYDEYLLAKIVMAEVGCESLESKVLVAHTILNRVASSKFPNTIEEVIFQNNGKVYQFTPIANGSWYKLEPNEECYEAVKIATASEHDASEGALFFEACKNPDNWHSRNLTFICQSDSTRFYK